MVPSVTARSVTVQNEKAQIEVTLNVRVKIEQAQIAGTLNVMVQTVGTLNVAIQNDSVQIFVTLSVMVSPVVRSSPAALVLKVVHSAAHYEATHSFEELHFAVAADRFSAADRYAGVILFWVVDHFAGDAIQTSAAVIHCFFQAVRVQLAHDHAPVFPLSLN